MARDLEHRLAFPGLYFQSAGAIITPSAPVSFQTALGESAMYQSRTSHDVRQRFSAVLARLAPSHLILPILAGIALWGVASEAQAQSSAQPVPAVRLYVLDCGSLKSGNPEPLLARGVTITDMSVACYLVAHPRGTLLWDAGTIPDELIKPGGATVVRATVHKTLSGQLAEIGYKPADITYLALSHYHYDHSANANQFAGSTWLVQGPERAAMFPDSPPANPIDPGVTAKFSALKNSKTTILNGDHDQFGDGSVVSLSTPGHTPGHHPQFRRPSKVGLLWR